MGFGIFFFFFFFIFKKTFQQKSRIYIFLPVENIVLGVRSRGARVKDIRLHINVDEMLFFLSIF
jgi:hypothetical protein